MQDEQESTLSAEEETVMQMGQAIEAMTKTEGFGYLKEHLETLAFHSWVDPRETESEQEWLWKEKVAWAGANAAKEIIDAINDWVQQAHELHKKKLGQSGAKRMKI